MATSAILDVLLSKPPSVIDFVIQSNNIQLT